MNISTWAELEELIQRKLQNRKPLVLDPPDFRHSAVLMPIILEEDRFTFILTQRTMSLKKHRGEISFPGGSKDKEDKSLENTALRETYEEIGVASEKVTILGRLDDLFTITRFIITPFIGTIKEQIECRSNDAEVAKILFVPFDIFLDKECFAEKNLVRNNTNYPLYYYYWNEYEIWGATAYIINQLMELLFDFQPSRINFKRKDPDIIKKMLG